jgi:hypothetical protein
MRLLKLSPHQPDDADPLTHRYRRERPKESNDVAYRPQSSSASRFTAGAFGFLTLIQFGDRPRR